MPAGMAQTPLDDFGGLIDWSRLNAWIAANNIPGAGPVTAVTRLAGGSRNNVFLMERGRESFVLRRPAKLVRNEHNEIMRREARILKALHATAVPHPHYYGLCEDESVIGACFYVMQAVEGFAQNGPLPGTYATDARWRRAMAEELVKAAAALGAIDCEQVGLDGIGKPDNWYERQATLWRSQFERYREVPNYAGNEPPHIEEVGRWLNDNLPSNRRSGIIHGDFQFPNVMFSLKSPRITGVIDWELATLGDPLLDLGWLLTRWWEEGDPDGNTPMVQPWDGFPPRSELVRAYGALSGRDMSEMPWFFALACFKLACLLEGAHADAKAGQVAEHVGNQVHAHACRTMKKAMQIIAQCS